MHVILEKSNDTTVRRIAQTIKEDDNPVISFFTLKKEIVEYGLKSSALSNNFAPNYLLFLHRNFAKKLHSIECNFFVFSIPDKYKTSNIYGFKTQGIGIGAK